MASCDFSSVQLEGVLQKLMKNLHCQICLELLTDPYALSCGHTFCYSCCFSWLKDSKTCPNCRAKINQAPTLVFVIKDMCQVVLDNTETLLENTRTLRINRNEDELISRSHEIFPGLFQHGPVVINGGRLADLEDHVYRCIRCHWEVEGASCSNCGYVFSEGAHSESDESSESHSADDRLTNEYDLEDSFVDPRASSDIESTHGYEADIFFDDVSSPISVFSGSASDENEHSATPVGSSNGAQATNGSCTGTIKDSTRLESTRSSRGKEDQACQAKGGSSCLESRHVIDLAEDKSEDCIVASPKGSTIAKRKFAWNESTGAFSGSAGSKRCKSSKRIILESDEDSA